MISYLEDLDDDRLFGGGPSLAASASNPVIAAGSGGATATPAGPGQTATVPSSDDPVGADGQGGTSTSVAASGDQRIDGLLTGVRWSNTSITYTDPDAAADYQSGYVVDRNGNGTSAQNEGFGQISASQLLAVHYALNGATYTQPVGAYGFSVEAFTGLDITYGGAGLGTGTIRVANTSDNATGYGLYPANSIYGGDAWMGTAIQTPVQGNYEWNNTLHELGHTLGLKHGQDTGGPANTALPSNVDSLEFTVMTYRSYVGGPTTGYSNGAWDYPQTYMMLDIAALQYMYGADFTSSAANVGNTTYTWSPTTGQGFVNGNLATNPGGNRIFMTIWDGGGTDTYDLSNYATNLSVDLNPGGSSTFDPAQRAYLGTDSGGTQQFARGNVFNALLYNNDERSLIENVIGGSGDDFVAGNNAANTFTGNGGIDSLWGLEGNDTLNGSAGDDSLKGGGGADTLSGGDDADTLKGGGEADTLIGGGGIDIATYTDSDAGVDVTLDGSGFFGTAAGDTLSGIENLYGSDYTDTLRGNGGANQLNGSGGQDVLIGLTGSDVFLVDDAGDQAIEAANGGAADTVRTSVTYALGAGQSVEILETTNALGTGAIDLTGNGLGNTVRGNEGVNQLYGLGEDDNLFGYGGSDILQGGVGDDSMRGGTGDDTYYVQDAGDSVVEGGNAGTDTIRSSVSQVLAANVENLILTGTDAINGNGNNGVNALTGNDAHNVLNGAAGSDTLEGLGGKDYFLFSTALGATNIDHIVDFAAGDQIRLDEDVFPALNPGALAAAAFKDIVDSPVDANDRIIYNSNTGNLWYDANGSAAGQRTLFAVLDNHADLAANNFLIVA